MSLIRYTPLVALLTLTLTACPSTNPVPVVLPVTAVAVSGPSNNAIKIGEPTPLTSSAKDASGNAITGKIFTWTSSDPNVASVDANGVVTAKRFGSVTISASTAGISGSSSSLKTYGLEAVGGTAIFGTSINVNTALLYRFRKADGSGNAGTTTLTLSGPTGWNGDKGQTVTDTLDGKSNEFDSFSTPALPGKYTLSTTVEGVSYSSSFTVSDVLKPLKGPVMITPSDLSMGSVSASWTSVPEATRYSFLLRNDTDKTVEKNTAYYTDALTGKIDGLTLDKTKTYFFEVYAFNISFCCPNDFSKIFPEQFNFSANRVKLVFP